MPWLTALNVAVQKERDEQDARKWRAVELGAESGAYPRKHPAGCSGSGACANLCYGGDMLILDEPFSGMDAALVKRMVPLILQRGSDVSSHAFGRRNRAVCGNVLRMQPELKE